MDSQSNAVQAQPVQGMYAQPVVQPMVQPYQPGFPQGDPQSSTPGTFPMLQQMGMGGSDLEAPGPLYNPEVRQAMESTGAWSDGLFDCFNDVGLCLMSACCLPCQQYRNIRRLGSVDVGGAKINAIAYIAIIIVIFVLRAIVVFFGGPYLSTWNCSWNRCSHYSVWSFVMDLITFAFLIGVFAGFVKKFRIKESFPIIFLKGWCCSCCYLAQISRHVFRATGYLPPTLSVVNAPPAMGAMEQPMMMPQIQPMVQQQQQLQPN